MKQIGITGQSGFIGTHLYSYLSQQKEICCIPFKDEYFDQDSSLDDFTSQCDTVIHLASVHRDPDQKKLYDMNIELTDKLLASCDRTKRCQQVLFTSSIQEANGNAYGESKKANRLKIENWGNQQGKSATSLVLPNVFGPAAKPFHTSFIATFSYQLWHNDRPVVIEDREVDLVFIYDLLPLFYEVIERKSPKTLYVPVSQTIKVSEVLQLLERFRDAMERRLDLQFQSQFEQDLFKAFCSYR